MARPWLLLFGLGGAVALWAYSRTQRGQVVVADALEEVTVTASRIGRAVSDALKPRGIRNNNPGNIEWIANPASRWRGMIGSDGRFGVFDKPDNGVRAIGGELRASVRKGQTVEQAIHEWAPPHENDTGAYVRVVASSIGVDKSARLTEAMLPAAALAIIKHENGQQPYDPALVAVWVYS